MEVALLRRAWEAVVQGESQAVLLRGEAGLGKSLDSCLQSDDRAWRPV